MLLERVMNPSEGGVIVVFDENVTIDENGIVSFIRGD
jgi:hypothetical protein